MPITITGGVVLFTPPTHGYITMTGADLIDAIARKMGRWARTTATGGTSTTMIDTKRYEADTYWVNHYLKCLQGANNGEQFMVTDWAYATYTATFAPTASKTWLSGDVYRLTAFDQNNALTTGVVKGYIDKAVEAAWPHAFAELVVTGPTVVAGSQEYSFRTVVATPTGIKELTSVEYQPSSTSTYNSLLFEIVGNGQNFRLLEAPSNGTVLRLVGRGLPLRTDSAGVVTEIIATETDRLLVQDGQEDLIILLAIREILLGQRHVAGALSTTPVMNLEYLEGKLIPEARNRWWQEPVKSGALWF